MGHVHGQGCSSAKDVLAALSVARGVAVHQAARIRRVASAVMSLREERTSKVEVAPPHAQHMFLGALALDEGSHDDEDVADASVTDQPRFGKPAQHDFLIASFAPRRTPQAELERPPRA